MAADDGLSGAGVVEDRAEAAGEPKPRRPTIHRTERQMYDTLSMLCHLVWHKTPPPGAHVWSIPVNEERDFDCILYDAVAELVQLRTATRALVEKLEAVRSNPNVSVGFLFYDGPPQSCIEPGIAPELAAVRDALGGE